MTSLASRLIGLAVLALFIALFLYFIKEVLVVIGLIIALLVLAGLLFYFRVRLAVRRFQKAFAKATDEMAKRQGTNPRAGEALDAEFKVKDGPDER